MNIEEIKEGETYNVRVKVVSIDEDGWYKVRTSDETLPFILSPKEKEAFSPISPANGTKNTETPPKYDPCRLFRDGDIVTPKERNGRIPWGKDAKLIVVEDEVRAGVTVRDEETGETNYICALFLELVTPVEELEPYYVSTNIDCSTCTIFKKVGEKSLVHSAYYFVHGNGCSNAILGITEAQAAAEAERDRLNAEYRKEQGNG